MQIVFAVSEVEDLVKTGGLADVGKSLPIALKALGHDVRIIMPLYSAIADANSLTDACVPLQFKSGRHSYQFGVKQLELHGVTVYLIDHPDYFMREGLYSNGYEAYPDNGQRFAFFSKASLVALSHLGFIPDIIHCNDWHTGMLPYYMRHNRNTEIVRQFSQTKSMLTIHNAAFQGVFEVDQIPLLESVESLEPYSHGEYVNFLQIGLACCDAITSVSPNYAKELLTDLGSHGLSDILHAKRDHLFGVLNGCDYSQWDPQTDTHIDTHFSIEDMAGKQACKLALQREAELPKQPSMPLIGMVCRLTEQKGFGYILPILERLLQHKLQMVIVGTGDPSVVNQLTSLNDKYPDSFKFINGFSNRLAHLIEAGCDFFLMPSQFEPCGLNQMYSLAYGTLPIVRAVGGLKDTVIDQEDYPDKSTGFVFYPPQPQALLDCIRRALLVFHESPDIIAAMQRRAMQTKFTWEAAAEQYAKIYTEVSQ